MTTFTIYELTDIDLGYIFFKAREKKKITQKEVAKRAKISSKSYCEFENGNQLLKLQTIISLCEILNVDLKFCVVK